MKKIKKSLTIGFLVILSGLILFSSFIEANAIQVDISEQKVNEGLGSLKEANKVQSLSMNTALDEATKNNSMIQSLNYLVKIKEIQAFESQDTAKRISENSINNLDLAKMKYFLPFDSKQQLEIAKIDREEKIDSFTLEIVNAYIDVIFFEDSIKVLDSGVKRAEEQLRIAKKNLELGIITKVDVLTAEVQLEKIKIELEQSKNNLEIKKMKLNQLMNRSLQGQITVEVPKWNDSYSDSKEHIDRAIEDNAAVKKMKLELESISKLLDLTGKYYPEKTYIYESTKEKKLTKEAQLAEAKSKVELRLRSQRILIDSLQNKSKLVEQQVYKVNETYDIMLHQYKAGFISYQELANTDQLLKQTSLEGLLAKLDYYRGMYEYKMMLGQN